MRNISIKNLFLFGGLSKTEFSVIEPLIWKRNHRILNVMSLLSALMGGFFLAYALLSRSGVWLPYLILLIGSAAVYLISRLARDSHRLLIMFLCYGQMLLVCAYAGVLSTQPSNYAVPATSIVVFIALLPVTIDDRLIRMFVLMIGESASYLVVSRLFKSSEAFGLDVINVVTFCVIGMVIYGVICTRNIREIYQGVHIEKIQRGTISAMATVVEERDESTGGHIVRTGNYVSDLIRAMRRSGKYEQLTESFYHNVILAAPMHDIGKIRIPDAILNKPGRLTPEEFEVMKRHSVYGAEIIKKTMKDVESEEYFDVACNIAKYHHERYDGKGYPEGLAGEAIPIEARIMALADVYDALVSERVYKKPFSVEKARAIIEEGCGTQFDPVLAQLFLKCIE